MTYTVKVEIKSWIDGRVLYAADVRTDVPDNLRTRAAVEEAVRNGVSLAGASLDGARLDGAILAGASLGGARLDGASLDGAILDGARLDGASLDGARLDGVSLAGARLDGASLDGASLAGASLDGARLDGARLNGTILNNANLTNAHLDRTRINGARLIRARLDGARIGLHTIKSLIARATRRDGYEFLAWRTEAGTVLITAGCQCVEGTDAYRKHVKTYGDRENGAALAAETLAILDYIDARAAQDGDLPTHVITLAEALAAARDQVKALTRDCQTLEMAYADEGALRISHEGLIEKLKARTTTAEAQVKEMRDAKLYAAAPMLVEALLKLANATDAVGVAHFDTDDMSDEVTEMQAATLEARRALAAAGVK